MVVTVIDLEGHIPYHDEYCAGKRNYKPELLAPVGVDGELVGCVHRVMFKVSGGAEKGKVKR